MVLTFSSPFFIVILSIIFLNDKVGIYRWSAIFIGFFGVVLIVQPGSDIFSFYSVFPVLTAIAWAFTVIILKFIPDGHSTAKIQLYTLIFNVIGGVILFDETIRQSAADGTLLRDLITSQDALPGIKVDKGLQPIDDCPGETVTVGLDGLDERLKEYSSMGAKFTKWRAVINIGEGIPTDKCIDANMQALADYAKCHLNQTLLLNYLEKKLQLSMKEQKSNWLKFSSIGFQIAASFLLFGWLGDLIDNRLSTNSIFLVCGLIIGGIASLYHIWKMAQD